MRSIIRLKRTNSLLLLCIVLIISFITCHDSTDEQDENPLPDEQDAKPLPIVSGLPAFFEGCTLNEGETALITNQAGFDTTFILNQLRIPDLHNVDLLENDILVGAESFTQGIADITYEFIEASPNNYLLKVKVIYDDTLPAGTFYYGIIIEKLPDGSIINFQIDKIY